MKDKIQEKINERIEQNKRAELAEEQFRCPLTGGKLIQEHIRYIMDGPSVYKAEGFSIVWKVYPRDEFNVYHTIHKGVEYSFKYHGNGNWQELILIKGETGKGIYIDKKLYDSKDVETLRETEAFLLKEKEAHEKELERRRNFKPDFSLPIARAVVAKTIASELVAVSPMSAPSGMLFFMEPPKSKVIVIIFGEGEFELDEEIVNNWKKKELEPGVFEFGTLKFSIKD